MRSSIQCKEVKNLKKHKSYAINVTKWNLSRFLCNEHLRYLSKLINWPSAQTFGRPDLFLAIWKSFQVIKSTVKQFSLLMNEIMGKTMTFPASVLYSLKNQVHNQLIISEIQSILRNARTHKNRQNPKKSTCYILTKEDKYS